MSDDVKILIEWETCKSCKRTFKPTDLRKGICIDCYEGVASMGKAELQVDYCVTNVAELLEMRGRVNALTDLIMQEKYINREMVAVILGIKLPVNVNAENE